jgi:hypothetical protein
MFCYSGLSEDDVLYLQHKHHVYMTSNGRISIAGGVGVFVCVCMCLSKKCADVICVVTYALLGCRAAQA